MKSFLLAVVLSTATPQVYWAIWGPLEVSTMTATMVDISTGPYILKASTGDCFLVPSINPNGTLPATSKWVRCPN